MRVGPGSNLRIGTCGWNYPTGRGPWNGVMIKSQLGETVEGEYPEAFIARYPELGDIVNLSHTSSR
jgi:hypothetical protein